MDVVDNHSANYEASIKPLARRPGPPKDTPRSPNAGRKKGTPNRITKDVREAAQKHGGKALKQLNSVRQYPRE